MIQCIAVIVMVPISTCELACHPLLPLSLPHERARPCSVKTIVFYTSIFDIRTKVYPNSTWQAGVQHFVAFVRGAASIKDLSPV